MREKGIEPYYHTPEYSDLKYKSVRVFEEGRDGYKVSKINPYPKYLHDYRADWTTGYLYEQRVTLAKEREQIARERGLLYARLDPSDYPA